MCWNDIIKVNLAKSSHNTEISRSIILFWKCESSEKRLTAPDAFFAAVTATAISVCRFPIFLSEKHLIIFNTNDLVKLVLNIDLSTLLLCVSKSDAVTDLSPAKEGSHAGGFIGACPALPLRIKYDIHWFRNSAIFSANLSRHKKVEEGHRGAVCVNRCE